MEGPQCQQEQKEAAECQICLNEYSRKRRAKRLGCRHTCCTLCLGRMVAVRRMRLDGDLGNRPAGTGSGAERHTSRRPAAVSGLEGRLRQHQPEAPGHGRTPGELEMGPGETAMRHSEARGGLDVGQAATVITPSSNRMGQNGSLWQPGVGGREGVGREHRTGAEFGHDEEGVDQRRAPMVTHTTDNAESNARTQMAVNDMEGGQRVMTAEHNDLDSSHQQRRASFRHNTWETNSYSRIAEMAAVQPEALSLQGEMMTNYQSESSRLNAIETEMSHSSNSGPGGNELGPNMNMNGMFAGEILQRTIVCPWCRHITVLPEGLSVNHFPDDQEIMASVTMATPPIQPRERTSVYIRLLPSTILYLFPWASNRNVDGGTDSVVIPDSSRYLLPLSVERRDRARDSNVTPSSSHYLHPGGRATYLRGGRFGGDASNLRAGERCIFPWPASRRRQSLPQIRNVGMEEIWQEVEMMDLSLEDELGEREREEEKRNSKMWTRVCTVLVLGVLIFLLICIILHSMYCPAKSFTMISCG